LPYDRFELLRPKQPLTEVDIEAFLNDSLGDIPLDGSDILIVPEHLRKIPKVDATDYIAQRKKCEDFYLYKDGFIKVHEELRSGKRSFVKFTLSQLEHSGSYFVLDGMLVYLAEVIDKSRDRRGRLAGRSICIFENGTMSDVKLDTLRKALYENGYAVRENNEAINEHFNIRFNATVEDKPTGWIYVLKSLSDNPEVKAIDNLYKIGFSTTPVAERIANAEHESTYLNAKVEIIATWKAYNMNVSMFESLIHRVFKDVRLQIRIGNHTPEEWFIVSYSAIEKAIQCIKNEIPISYDAVNQIIVEHTVVENKEKKTIDITGWKILTLNIKENYFREILSGTKRKEYRLVKSTTINKYTCFEEGKRWLRRYDAIRFFVGYHKDRESALVELVNAEYNPDEQMVIYSLGKVFEIGGTTEK
jgi:T5orf172 domain.